MAQKKLIKKANELYKAKQYTSAIKIYEEALATSDNLAASIKLANAYRLTNQTDKAEIQYSEIVKNPKAKPRIYYLYAESLMSNGKYDKAKEWFLKYNEKEPDNKDAIRMAYACDRVKNLEPYFPNVRVTNFEHNSDADDGSPIQTHDGIVFTSDRVKAGVNPLKKKSGWTGRDYQRIYFSAKDEEGDYTAPQSFSKKLNGLNMHCGPISFNEDHTFAVFSRTSATPDKNNTYNIQLFSATSENGKKWKKVELLSFCKPDKNYMHPALSPDGNQLFFVSDKSGGLGGTDIYVSKKEGEKWSSPKNLGPVINTSSNEGFPFFHSSGKLFFASKGHLSYGGFDILFSNLKEDDNWQKPVNIGQPINSSQDDISIYLNEDLNKGCFVSSREGGDDNIYLIEALAGTNADLEEIDFDTATDGPEIGGIKLENDASKATKPSMRINNDARHVDNPSTITDDEPRRYSNEMEVESSTFDTDNSPITTPADPSAPQVSTSDKISLSEQPEAITATELGSPTEKNVLPYEESAQENNLSDMKESIATDVKSNNNQINSAEPDEGTQELTTSILKNGDPAIENTDSPVNLMVPSNSAKASTVTPNTTDEVIEHTTTTHDDELIPISSRAVTTSEENKKFETPVSRPEDLHRNAEDRTETILEEHTQILDRNPDETAPPALMNEYESISSDPAKTMIELAEGLQVEENLRGQKFSMENVRYARGSFLLTPENIKALAGLVDLMERHPKLHIQIASHTSALGDDIENHNLSTKRAKSIKAFMIYKGIDESRIQPKGYGETKLLNECSNGVTCSEEQHAQNDRIEIIPMR